MFASSLYHPSLADVLQEAPVRKVFGEEGEGIINSQTNPEVWKGLLSSTTYLCNSPWKYILY